MSVLRSEPDSERSQDPTGTAGGVRLPVVEQRRSVFPTLCRVGTTLHTIVDGTAAKNGSWVDDFPPLLPATEVRPPYTVWVCVDGNVRTRSSQQNARAVQWRTQWILPNVIAHHAHWNVAGTVRRRDVRTRLKHGFLIIRAELQCSVDCNNLVPGGPHVPVNTAWYTSQAQRQRTSAGCAQR